VVNNSIALKGGLWSTLRPGCAQVGSVANSAGVGGGAIFVPVLQALVGFSECCSY